MAEFIFKKMVRDAGLAVDGEAVNGGEDVFRVDSAAVSFEEIGNDIYPSAKWTLAVHGIPFGRHSAHKVLDAQASGYDVIVIMDSSNRRPLLRIISPESMSKVHSMLEYDGKAPDVSVPWYTGDSERTYGEISEGEGA